MRLFTTLLLVCGFAAYAAGQHQVRVQNSFFLTGQPLFGVGYSYGEEDSRFTYGLHLEGGMYAHHDTDLINASWESYSISGFALLPEVRYYFSSQLSPQRGLFTSAFGHLRRMREYTMDGVPSAGHYRRGHSFGGGIAFGYTVGCGETPLMLEILAGYGAATDHWQQPARPSEARERAGTFDSASTLYRLELALSYRLK